MAPLTRNALHMLRERNLPMSQARAGSHASAWYCRVWCGVSSGAPRAWLNSWGGYPGGLFSQRPPLGPSIEVGFYSPQIGGSMGSTEIEIGEA
jgi:hypothetical protein